MTNAYAALAYHYESRKRGDGAVPPRCGSTATRKSDGATASYACGRCGKCKRAGRKGKPGVYL